MADDINRHSSTGLPRPARSIINRDADGYPIGPINDRPAAGLFGAAAGGRTKPMAPTHNPAGAAPTPKPKVRLRLDGLPPQPQAPTGAPRLRAAPQTRRAAKTATKAAEHDGGAGAGAGLVLGAALGGVGVAVLRHKRKEQPMAKSAFGVEDNRGTVEKAAPTGTHAHGMDVAHASGQHASPHPDCARCMRWGSTAKTDGRGLARAATKVFR